MVSACNFPCEISENLPTRTTPGRTIRETTDASQPAYVTVNDAEGCAPLSIQILAQASAA